MGLTGIFLYSYSSVQLHKKWSSELFSENYSYSYIKNGFRIKDVMISKRMGGGVTRKSVRPVFPQSASAKVSHKRVFTLIR